MSKTRPIIGSPAPAAAIEAPLALYVHVPWCVRKCPYCDFNSHVVPGSGVPARAFAAAALADLDCELAQRPPPAGPVRSVFFGGGTPSLLEPGVVAELLGGIRQRLTLAADAEITLEANPGTVERGRFAEYAAGGINRISLGVQSFDDRLLSRIGRIHSGAEAVRAAEELHACRFENFNLDLMYALPGQTPKAALADLERALALAPPHLSWYELTLEPGTAFGRRPPPLPPERDVAAMEAAGHARLAAAGLVRYEVSAYARSGYRCRHNDNYWCFGDYIGVGPGAHGKRSAGATIRRTERIRAPGRWLRLAGAGAALQVRTVDPDTRAFEFLLGALRRVEGFAWREFEGRTGLGRDAVAAAVAAAHAEGLLALAPGRVRATPRGFRHLNDLQARFLPG